MANVFHRKQAEAIDEHDQPTEPLPEIQVPEVLNVPAPQPHVQPFPRDYVADNPPQAMPKPSRAVREHQPERGKKISPSALHKQRKGTSLRRLLLAPGIRLCFLLIQIVLLYRFIVVLFFIPIKGGWMQFFAVFSDLLLLPFHAFLPALPAFIPANIELYTLLAIAVYNLLSRFIRLMIRVIPDSR